MASLIRQGSCLAGGRVLQEAARAIRDEPQSQDEEENELERFLFTLQKQNRADNEELKVGPME